MAIYTLIMSGTFDSVEDDALTSSAINGSERAAC